MNTSVNQCVVDRVRAEYLEMPGLSLKPDQLQRLCGIEPAMCRAVLDVLVDTKFLCMKSNGVYARLMDGEMPRPRPAKGELESHIVAMTSPSKRHVG